MLSVKYLVFAWSKLIRKFSKQSISSDASKPVKDFIESIINATNDLVNDQVEDAVLIDFKINLVNENKATNADIVAVINNTTTQQVNFNVVKQPKVFRVSKDENATMVNVTRDKSISKGILVHEELSEGIFEEINNIIDANEKLRNGKPEFMMDENIYYRIYSELT